MQRNSRGAAFVELAIVIPVIILFFMCAFELIFQMKSERLLSNLNVELLKQFYKGIEKSHSDAAVPGLINNYMKSYLNSGTATSVEVGDLRSALIPDAEVRVSVYKINPGAAPTLVVKRETNDFPPSVIGISPEKIQLLSISKLNQISVNGQILNYNQRILVVESVVFRESLFRIFLGDRYLYEVGIV